MRVLHRHGLGFKTELTRPRGDLDRIVVGEQHAATDIVQQTEQAAVIELPIRVQTSSRCGVGWIDEECGTLVVGIRGDDLESVTFDECEALPNLCNIRGSR